MEQLLASPSQDSARSTDALSASPRVAEQRGSDARDHERAWLALASRSRDVYMC